MASGRGKVLVTGGAGYIGSHVVKQLRDDGRDVVVYDNLSTGHEWAVQGVDFVRGDLADAETLSETFRRNEVASVLHFAASI